MRRTDSRDPREPDSSSEHALRELFARAAPRPAPPDADAAEIRRAVYEEWDALTGRRVLLRRLAAGVAATITIVAVLFVAIQDRGAGPTPPLVARVERLRGVVEVVDERGSHETLQVGAQLREGSSISTGSGYVALRMAVGSLRLAPRTRMTLSGDTQADLIGGQVYFDSEANDNAASELAIVTAVGTLRDVGTQFIARLEANRLEVGVRDGQVAIDRGDERVAAQAGELVSVPEGRGGVRREAIEIFGDHWAWAEQLAPPFEIDGSYLIDFLSWVAGQTGRTVVFADSAAEQTARETVLNGSIDLEPLPKLAAVMTLTELGYSLNRERIIISSTK
jgi:hypothetical protein